MWYSLDALRPVDHSLRLPQTFALSPVLDSCQSVFVVLQCHRCPHLCGCRFLELSRLSSSSSVHFHLFCSRVLVLQGGGGGVGRSEAASWDKLPSVRVAGRVLQRRKAVCP